MKWREIIEILREKPETTINRIEDDVQRLITDKGYTFEQAIEIYKLAEARKIKYLEWELNIQKDIRNRL